MYLAPVHPDETDRVNFLNFHEFSEMPRQIALDRLVFTAAQLFHAPIALITLVYEERVWFKAQVGIEFGEIPRSSAFCDHTIMGDEALIVPDAPQDARFADSPMVAGPPFLRFYAGVPLLAPEKLRLGALCVLDHRPRMATPSQIDGLRGLARTAMQLMIDQAARLAH